MEAVEASVRPREVEHDGVQVYSEFGKCVLQRTQQVYPFGHVTVEAPIHMVAGAVGHQSEFMRCRTCVSYVVYCGEAVVLL